MADGVWRGEECSREERSARPAILLGQEAGDPFVDTGVTIVTYFAVRAAHKPADAEHQYGHGKLESLAALAEMVVLFIVATLVLVEASRRIAEGGGASCASTNCGFGQAAQRSLGSWKSLSGMSIGLDIELDGSMSC
ncbi:cation transporter [Mesorhizobium sp. VK24D]|uniref:Cation transporter n=1 Tax=Mesorhizobium album TaxID=3072314 RepID=A0ABU4XW46_9HYPH|nr:cation transporter [Mesorhizobium sp. VK24D]MDX8478919.1 cation transporter [Mesorhizobium sp. VK24D]